jgi:hypothetical protein
MNPKINSGVHKSHQRTRSQANWIHSITSQEARIAQLVKWLATGWMTGIRFSERVEEFSIHNHHVKTNSKIYEDCNATHTGGGTEAGAWISPLTSLLYRGCECVQEGIHV